MRAYPVKTDFAVNKSLEEKEKKKSGILPKQNPNCLSVANSYNH
jgi:hypothetical protein